MDLTILKAGIDADITNKVAPRSIPAYIVGGRMKETIDALNNGKIDETDKASPNGLATLDENGKVPASQIRVSPQKIKGAWNAENNTPYIQDGTGDPGDTYIVSKGGVLDLGSGDIIFTENDSVVLNENLVWEKIPGNTNYSFSNQFDI